MSQTFRSQNSHENISNRAAPNPQLMPAATENEDFIFEVFEVTMKDYVAWAWGWDKEVQRKRLLSEKNLTGFQLIMLQEEKVGALLLEKTAHQHYLRTIFLLPKFHGQGIGREIVLSLQDDARIAMKPLGLRVIQVNPARRLYERLGFKVIGQDEKTLLMQWQAAP